VNNSFKVQTAKWKIFGLPFSNPKSGCKAGGAPALQLIMLALLLWFVSAAAVQAQYPATWHLLIEPIFMKPEVSFPIPGAERTVFVPAYMDALNEPVYLTKAQFAALGVDFAGFLKQSLANASDKKVKAEFVRDEKQVVKYATLQSDNPLTATMVLSPQFLKMFADIFGDKPLVALPNRYTVYIFPKLASDYRNYAEMVISDYRDSAYPVSLEVFEVGSEGMKAVGTYETKWDALSCGRRRTASLILPLR
jgi:hypothetical protein